MIILPYEIILNVLNYSDIYAMHKWTRCNKYIRKIYIDNIESLYKNKLILDFNMTYKYNKSWKIAYIQYYKWERIKSIVLRSHWGYKYLRFFSKNRDMDKDILNYIYDDVNLFRYNMYRMKFIDCYTREFVLEFKDKILKNTEKTFFENFYIRSTKIPIDILLNIIEDEEI